MFHLLISKCFTKGRQGLHSSFTSQEQAQRCGVSWPKAKGSQEWAGLPALPPTAAEVCFERGILGFGVGAKHLEDGVGVEAQKAENPVIVWLKEVADVQCGKGWHFLSWALPSAFLFSFLSTVTESTGCRWLWVLEPFFQAGKEEISTRRKKSVQDVG